jgi:hypothetical protein
MGSPNEGTDRDARLRTLLPQITRLDTMKIKPKTVDKTREEEEEISTRAEHIRTRPAPHAHRNSLELLLLHLDGEWLNTLFSLPRMELHIHKVATNYLLPTTIVHLPTIGNVAFYLLIQTGHQLLQCVCERERERLCSTILPLICY